MIGRRQILKAIGISPAAAAVVLPALEASAAGIGVGAASTFGNSIGAGALGQPPSGPSPIKILNWASWLKRVGDEQFREQAREVRNLDADIAAMHLPLNTKVKWQQERNYLRIVANSKSWFDRQLERQGFVEHWS